MQDIDLRIREIRKKFELTQTDFADKIQITRNLLAQIETNKSLPTLNTVYLIVKYFNINYEWLFTGEGPMLASDLPKESNLVEHSMSVNERIISLRKFLNLNQLDFAKSIGAYNQANISDIERGRVKPDVEFITLLLKKYNINIEWLLIGEGSMLRSDSPKESNLVDHLMAENKALMARIEELNREIGKLQNK